MSQIAKITIAQTTQSPDSRTYLKKALRTILFTISVSQQPHLTQLTTPFHHTRAHNTQPEVGKKQKQKCHQQLNASTI